MQIYNISEDLRTHDIIVDTVGCGRALYESLKSKNTHHILTPYQSIRSSNENAYELLQSHYKTNDSFKKILDEYNYKSIKDGDSIENIKINCVLNYISASKYA